MNNQKLEKFMAETSKKFRTCPICGATPDFRMNDTGMGIFCDDCKFGVKSSLIWYPNGDIAYNEIVSNLTTLWNGRDVGEWQPVPDGLVHPIGLKVDGDNLISESYSIKVTIPIGPNFRLCRHTDPIKLPSSGIWIDWSLAPMAHPFDNHLNENDNFKGPAKFHTVDADGICKWHWFLPKIKHAQWVSYGYIYRNDRSVDIVKLDVPIGIDWRTLVDRNPEAKW